MKIDEGELYFVDSNGEQKYLGKFSDFVSIDEFESDELIDCVNKETENYINLLKKDFELSFTVNCFNSHILDRQQVIEEIYQKHKWGFL